MQVRHDVLLLLRCNDWDTKPDKRIRGTSSTLSATRRTCFYAALPLSGCEPFPPCGAPVLADCSQRWWSGAYARPLSRVAIVLGNRLRGTSKLSSDARSLPGTRLD